MSAKLEELEGRDEIAEVLDVLTLGLAERVGDLLDPEKTPNAGLIEKYNQARMILEAVENDGSWGVHNLKYTEAMLLKAREIISEVE